MPAASHRFGTIADERSTTQKGYGAEHQKARRAAAALHDETDPCARCGLELGPMGPHLHFDHDGDRSDYIGFSHARCNIVAGAREGRRRQAEATGELPIRPPRRDWYT